MGLFSVFKKNKGNENTEGNGNFLENYFKSRFKINTDHIQYSSNDIARIEKNCEILGKMGIPGYKDLKLVPVDSIVEIEEKQELVLHFIFDFFVGRKAFNRLNNRGDVDDADVMMLALKYAPEFNQLSNYLSEISKGNIGEDQLQDLAFWGEQARVLAWVLGLAEKPVETELTLGSDLVNIFEKYNSIEALIEGSNIISKDEIMEYADYISRLDFYCMELTLSQKDIKELHDFKLDCIREHKSAIDKVTSFSIDKYLTSK
ncbi:MAG: DUF4272 domain-containing protein [Lachnospiraceae bacterium]|jgi:hypothetical protein|nr:DUF4272 domain-containing protein [Lachnospiraceae bacterium]